VKYWDVIRALGGEGYTVLTFDHRSQGFSGRTVEPHDMSHVEDFERYVKDALEVLEERVFKVGEGTRKISIVGHSMGGLISLLVSERLGVERVNSVSTVAPMICFKTPPFPWKIAGVLGKVLPAIGLGEQYTVGFPKDNWEPSLMNWPLKCTHSVERAGCWVRQQAEAPIISLAGPSNTWVASAWNACDEFMEKYCGSKGSKYPVPWIMIRPTDDRFVHCESQDLFALTQKGGGRIVKVEGAYHEVLIESDEIREKVLGEIFNFVKVHISTKGLAVPASLYTEVAIKPFIPEVPTFEVRRMEKNEPKGMGRDDTVMKVGMIVAAAAAAAAAVGGMVFLRGRRI